MSLRLEELQRVFPKFARVLEEHRGKCAKESTPPFFQEGEGGEICCTTCGQVVATWPPEEVDSIISEGGGSNV